MSSRKWIIWTFTLIISLASRPIKGQDIWTLRSPSSANHNPLSVTYGKGLYIVVGENGTIASSPDGIDWTSRNSGTNYTLQSVAYGDSLFVATGDSGAIVLSSDGSNWTKQAAVTLAKLISIAWGNKTFVCISDSGAVFISQNGTAWSKKLQTSIYDGFKSVVWSGNKFLIGDNEYGDPSGPMSGSIKIYSSTDGNTWNSKTWLNTDYAKLTALAWGGTNSVAFTYNTMPTMPECSVYYSTDGDNWTRKYIGKISYTPVIWGNNTFIAIGGGGKITSPDGNTWTQSSLSGTVPYDLTCGYSLFVGLGNGGIYTAPFSTTPVNKIRSIISNKNSEFSIERNAIKYILEKPSLVLISCNDVKGQIIKYLVNKTQSSGNYEIRLPALSAGVYAIHFNKEKIAAEQMVVICK